MKVKPWPAAPCARRRTGGGVPRRRLHGAAGRINQPESASVLDGIEFEQTRWDPKDGELYRRRVKPGETLVEARSDADVQLARQTWV